MRLPILRLKKQSQTTLSIALGCALIGIGVALGASLPHTALATVTGDLNGDGLVNTVDLSILLSHWSNTSNQSPTPSPVVINNPIDPGTGTKLPAQILNLTDWHITLPIDGKGGTTVNNQTCNAEEIDQPQLATFSLAPWFHADAANDGVVFRANIEGCTTSGSEYPRSELREEDVFANTDGAGWSVTSGTSTMDITEAITHLPVVKPQTVFAQIHNASDDVFEAEATGQADGTAKLYVNHNGTIWGSDLDDHYILGTKFTLKIIASGGYIDVFYNGVQKVHQASTATGCYFKAGDYTQSNIIKGKDTPGAYGETVIYSLAVSHT